MAESDPWWDWDGWADTSFTPLQLSLIGGPTQIFKEKVPVLGLRLSGLHAIQSTVKGLDLGIFNLTDDLTGLGVGLVNVTYGDVTVDEEDLTIPHPRMHEREFVLRGLKELQCGRYT